MVGWDNYHYEDVASKCVTMAAHVHQVNTTGTAGIRGYRGKPRSNLKFELDEIHGYHEMLIMAMYGHDMVIDYLKK